MQKTAKEWWDESGFGTVLYWDNGSNMWKVVLVGVNEYTGNIICFIQAASSFNLTPDTILSDKPPKKKVKKYLWVYRESDGRYDLTNRHYKDESSALQSLDYSDTIVQRIDESAIEVEE